MCQIKAQDEKQHQCTDGYIVKDEDYCPTVMTCPKDLIKVNAYTCSYYQDFTPQSKCSVNLECWNGDCVEKTSDLLNFCPSSITCPPEFATKCPDNTCVVNIVEWVIQFWPHYFPLWRQS